MPMMIMTTVAVATAATAMPQAELTISGPWGDNMVLQSNHFYGQRAFMSGTAAPGSLITIVAPMREDKGSRVVVTADEQGHWKATLEPVQASMRTYNISISAATPAGTVYSTQTARQVDPSSTLASSTYQRTELSHRLDANSHFAGPWWHHQVRFGDVIICGGQSNMDRVVAYDSDNGTAEIAAASRYANIFLWTQPGVRPVPLQAHAAGQAGFRTGSWLQAVPATVSNFSAVCYETARQLVDRHLGNSIPVGLVWTAVGGTPLQQWMPPTALTAPGCDQTPNITLRDSSLYEQIILPLTNYSHRGVIWFQGEANVDGHERWLGDKYGACFKAMISGWREAFGIGDFAFVFVQLAPYLNKGNITEVRLQQASAIPSPGIGKGVDTTGMVVTIDKGDIYGGVHSHHKSPVAERSALAFLHVAYALQVGGVGNLSAFEGPKLRNATVVSATPVQVQGLRHDEASPVLIKIALLFDDGTVSPLHFGDTTSCGLQPNPDDKHWLQNKTAVHNSNCSGLETDISALASSIGCCCDSPGNGSFFICTGPNKTTVRVSDPAAGCQPAKATISTGTPGQIIVETRLLSVTGTVSSPIRVAIMSVDQPGCALYSRHGLPTAPAFIDVAFPDTAATSTATAVSTIPSALTDQSIKMQQRAAPPRKFNALPPMGYNTWNAIHTNVDENLIVKIAQVMIDTGLHDAGFQFVNIDDGWTVDRDPDGKITADPVRFPSGIKAVSDAIHALGLKFGVYTATHEFTCQHRPGSWQHEAIDSEFFCDNQVDFIKIDTCGGRCYPAEPNGTTPNLQAYRRFRDALDRCNHQIVEHCTSYDWNPQLPNPCNVVDAQNGCPHAPDGSMDDSDFVELGDIQSNFASILRILDNSEPCLTIDTPDGPHGGLWLDFDMLEVGNPGLSPVEARSHFTIWAGACSTLLIGTDITDPNFVTSDAHKILTNKELIDALSQDSLGVPIHRTRNPRVAPPSDRAEPKGSSVTAQLWSKPLADGGVAVILFNRRLTPISGWTFDFRDVGLSASSAVSIRDLWSHTDNGTHTSSFKSLLVEPHGVVALRLSLKRVA